MSRFLNEVKDLNLPVGKYTVVGGGALAARGLREANDIDLLLNEDLYDQLKNEGWEEKEKRTGYYHLYKGKAEAAKNFLHIEGCKLDPEDVIKNSDILEEVPVMNLADSMKLKQIMGREKDLLDIELMKSYLAHK